MPLGLTPAESPGVVSFRADFRKETWALPRVRLAVPKRRTCEDGVGAALWHDALGSLATDRKWTFKRGKKKMMLSM